LGCGVSLDVWVRLRNVEPSWVREYFFILYREFRDKSFTVEEFRNVLVKVGRSIDNVYKVLSPLMKVGLVRQVSSSRDSRTLYQIVIQRNDGVRVPSKDEVLRLLKSAADIIRTAVSYECILLLLFYKVVSDKWEVIASMNTSYYTT
jgi:hypothetical protein